ncbi:MAG TPA: ABC transporter permease [Pyrinomonadaceae bacterium]|nr:ABC transporter permease [Pyrinomonadaceae bacterium]
MRTLLQDLKFGTRTLLKRPGFTLVAVLTLALGIGANTAIFSVVNAVLLKPLPFKDSERLVLVYETTQAVPRDFVSVPDLQDYREGSRSFEEFATFVPQSVNMTGSGEPERVVGGFATSTLFPLLGVNVERGRALTAEDDAEGGGLVAVVGNEFWQRRFGGDPGIVGRPLTFNGEPFTVVGVMPAGFEFHGVTPDVLLPAHKWPNYKVARSSHNCWVFGRLKDGVSRETAEGELDAIAKRLEEAYPADNKGRGVEVIGLHEEQVEDIRPALLILLGAVGFILLIACANIANLLLARGASRRREVALRSALGASRVRLLRQLLTETLLLSLVGGVAGLIFAQWGVDALLTLNSANIPLQGGLHVGAALDARVLLFSLGLSILTGFVFGIVPALQLSKTDLNDALKEGGKTVGGGGSRSRLRGAFVVSQVALSLVLLVGAGLLLNSFYRLLRAEPGFDPRNLLTMEYRLPRNRYSKGEQQWAFHKEVVERVSRVPGVVSAAVVRGLPFSGNGGSLTYQVPDRPAPPAGQESKALENAIDPNYLRTVGLPLLRGRNFTLQDGPDSQPVVLVNRTMAEKLWPGEDPLGKRLDFPEVKMSAAVVGVVGDAKQYDLGETQMPQVYTAYAQNPHIFGTLVVRANVEPLSLSKQVREAVWSVDPDQPVWKVRTVEYLMGVNVSDRRFLLYLMACFAGLALLLTALGIYGVVSYTVAQRTHEIGIRVALGAQGRDVLRLVLRQGMGLALLGVSIGLVAAYGVTRYLASLLYGVSTTDPPTYAAVALLLAGVALLACLVPARRATRVDPMVALRHE